MHIAGRDIAVSNLLLTLAMAAFVAVPLAGALWHGTRPAESNVEKRRLAGLPAWPTSLQAWTKFPKAFDAWAHDQFGFRDDLLQGYRWLMASVFHQSTSDRAFVGREGWLYFAGNDGLADMRGVSSYTDAQLRNDVEQINARGELLAVRGIRYGFVVFPDKHTAYPQFLPGGVYAGFEHRRLNALDTAMAQTGRDYYFDATDVLRRDAMHSSFPLYYKSDTHWNPWGAYLGYEAWVAASGTKLGLRPFNYSFDQFRMAHRSLNGDLSKMSGYHPYDPDIYPPAGAGCESAAPWNVPNAMLRSLNTIASHMRIAECGGTGTALILHDSFLDSIERYVTDDFKRSWLVWNYPGDKDFGWLIDKWHPDTVLVERVERLMHYLRPVDFDALVRELGVVGESASFDSHGQLLIGSGDNRKELSHESIAGGLDRVVRDGDQMHVEGWVRIGDASPVAVIAVLDGKVVGEAPVTLYRADVAASQHDPKLMWSGFRMGLPVDVSGRSGQTLRFYCVGYDSYGEFSLIARDDQKLKHAEARSGGWVGAHVAVDANGNLEVANRGVLQNGGQISGSLDRIVRDGDFVQLSGWAGLNGSPASNVIAVMDDQVIGEAPVIVRRVDVANAYQNPQMTWSGFQLRLPARAIGRDGRGLRLYFINADRVGQYPMKDNDRKRLQAVLH